MQVKKQELEQDMEQWTGSKLRKEYVRAVYCHSAYLIYMQVYHAKCWAGWSTSWNQDCQQKHRQPQICRWYHSNGRKQRGTKEPLDKGKRREWKSWLKTQHWKTKIMASNSITLWQIEGEKVETMTDCIFLGSKITADGDWSHEIKKKLAPWKKSYEKHRQNVKKQRHHFVNKGPYSQSYGFSSSHIWMWELDHNEGWARKNLCFQTLVLEKTLESLLDCKEIKPVLKRINSKYSLEGLMLKLQYFGHLIQRVDSLEKTLMLGKNEGNRRMGQQRMRWLNGITYSMDMNLSKLWDIGNLEDKEFWSAAIHWITKGHTQLSNWTTTSCKFSFHHLFTDFI